MNKGDKVKLINETIATILDIVKEPISNNEVYLIDKSYKGTKDFEYGYNRQYYGKGTWFVYRGEIKERIGE